MPDVPRRRQAILWTIVVVVVATAGYVYARHRRDFWDFEVYRTAGARVLAAQPLYQAEDLHYQFKYWPAFAFAMVPFARLSPEAGKVIWYALSVAFIALLIQWSIAELPDRRRPVRVLAWWTLLLTGKFIVRELVNGQTNSLMAVLVVFMLAAAARGRRGAAGALAGLAVFVKPYALILVPWLAVAEGVPALAACLGVLAFGLLLPAGVYGWHGNLALIAGWYHTVTGTTSENLMLAENISFATMWAKWLGPGRAASLLTLGTTGAVLALVVAVWAMRRRVARPDYLEVSLLLLLVPLISPQGWDYVLLLGTPAIVLLVDRFGAKAPLWQVLTAAGLFLTSLSVYDIVGRRVYFLITGASLVTVGALLLSAALTRLRLRSLG